jgi:TonB-linked SusC/RagA family outer membrane protein
MKKHLKQCMEVEYDNLSQTLRIMKTTALLIFLCMIQISARTFSQDIRMTINMNEVTVQEVLDAIEKKSNIKFLYRNETLSDKKVCIAKNNATIDDILTNTFAKTDVTYKTVGNNLIVISPVELLNQKNTITGQVLDNKGTPLLGVSIGIKGTTIGTITDAEGKFSIEVPDENAILVFSFIGYLTEDVSVKGKTSIDVTMVEDIIGMDEVVVIGYGTVKKSDVTGAVASVSTEELSQSVGSGVDQALQGRTAGVTITTNSGTPGAAPSVRIRGTGTVTNSNPFFVVDGMPISSDAVGALNPGDIESMEILKDASASAIYGARAANGVVLITTKQGKSGKSTVSFDASWGTQSIAKKYELLNAEEYITLRNTINKNWEDSSQVPYSDWQDLIFRSAKVSEYQLSMLGGSDKMKYAVTGSYFNQEGILRGTDFERITTRINLSADVKPWIKLGENLTLINSTRNVVPEQDEYTSVVITALIMDPAIEPYDSAGNSAPALRNNIANPMGLINRNHNVTDQTKLFGNFYLELKPLEWLKFRSSFGIEINNRNQEIYLPVYYETGTLSRTENSLWTGDFKTRNWLWENTLSFQKEIGKHNFQAIIGYTAQEDIFRQEMGYGTQISENRSLWFVNNAKGTTRYSQFPDGLGQFQGVGVSTTPYDLTMVSQLGRAMYSWNNIIDLTGSVRRDGSSRFGKKRRYGVFPSFSAGIKLSELSFLKNIPYLSFLKVRGGWGKLGNQELGSGATSYYPGISTISTGFNYTYGNGGAQTMAGSSSTQTLYPGGAPTSFSNPFLQWETTKQTNLGIDINMLSNSVTLNLDYYIKTTTDMLVEVPVPFVSGIQVPPFVNMGSVENKGLEINASYKKKIGNLSYEINGNIAFTKNEVLSLGENGDESIQSASFMKAGYISRTEVGQPIASFYGFVTDGYWQNQEEIDAANILAANSNPTLSNVFYDKKKTSPGDIKYKDINGDNRITNLDRTYIGSPHPKYTYGININLGYKNFDFKIFGQGVAGNKIFMATINYLESDNLYWNGLSTMNDHWKEEGDNSSVPRLDLQSSNDNMRYSDRHVKKGDFFRIKNAQLGYTLPTKLSQSLKIERFRIYVSGQNLISFHKYKGFDPEIGVGRDTGSSVQQRGGLDIGIDRGMYPIARVYMIGINLSF